MEHAHIKPLNKLSAEECRNANKEFEGLDYSSSEEDCAQKLSARITEAARLGFGEIVFYRSLSEKMTSCLQRRGFVVTPLYHAEWTGICISGSSNLRLGYCSLIRWSDASTYTLREGESFSKEEIMAYIEKKDQEAKEREDEMDKQIRDKWESSKPAPSRSRSLLSWLFE
jgi:hypothetical protein